MRCQPGFFDIDERLKRLSDLGDQLEAFAQAVDFEIFRATFLKIAARIDTLRTRIRVSFPSATPNKPVIAHMLSAMEARTP
jgi:hypothetical protein